MGECFVMLFCTLQKYHEDKQQQVLNKTGLQFACFSIWTIAKYVQLVDFDISQHGTTKF